MDNPSSNPAKMKVLLDNIFLNNAAICQQWKIPGFTQYLARRGLTCSTEITLALVVRHTLYDIQSRKAFICKRVIIFVPKILQHKAGGSQELALIDRAP